jgi:hypothetical protein
LNFIFVSLKRDQPFLLDFRTQHILESSFLIRMSFLIVVDCFTIDNNYGQFDLMNVSASGYTLFLASLSALHA